MGRIVSLFTLIGLVSVCLSNDRVQIDLQYSDSPRGYSRYIHFLQTPTISHTGACDRQAVVKIDFSGPFKGAELSLVYGKSPRSWTLDISDSPTGDGFGGDDGTTSNMAEVQILNRQMRIYGNKLPGYMDATSDGGLLIKVIDGFATKGSKATISFSDERLKWSRGKIDEFLDSKFLFTLNGQKTVYGEVDYSVYIGFNRVVAGNYRNGSGLCSVDVKLIKIPGNGCKNGTLKCHTDAECIDGEFRPARCRCKKGFHGTGRFCEDTNECDYKNGGCVHVCHNHKGNFSCACRNGFQLDVDQKDCVDKNECFSDKGGCQHQCKNTLGGYECKCNQGYTLEDDGKICKVGTWCRKRQGCEHSCRTTQQGTVVCTCRNGYKLHSNGKTCIQTCRVGNGGCQHICTDTPDGVNCSCAVDYILRADKTCTATCNVSNGGCSKKCKDTENGPVCTCPDGYELHQDQKSCLDINECEVHNGNCSHNCTNIAGGYTCDCPKGHEVANDGKTCEDVNECDTNGTCDHICKNSPGSYTCKCNPGYDIYGWSHCADRDECSENNGGCEHKCINTVGDFKCVCNDGYKLDKNGKDCVALDTCHELPLEPAANTSCENRDQDILCIHKCKSSKYKFTADTDQSVMSTHCGPGTKYNWDHEARNKTLPSCSSEIATPSVAKKLVMKFVSQDCKKRTSVRTKTAQNITSILNTSKQFKCKGNCEIVDSINLKCTRIIHRFTGAKSSSQGGYSMTMELFLAYRAEDKDKKNCNSNCEMKKTEKKLKKVVKRLRQAVKQKTFSFGFVGRTYIADKFKSPRGATIKLCDKNWMLVKDTCVGCPVGSFYNRNTESCEKCSPGFYQDEEAQRRCKSCRKGSHKQGIYGASSLDECEVLCEPGQYSKNGLKPCTPCPTGSYQPEYGRLTCQKCPGKVTTSSEGSTSFRSCETQDICEAGHYYDVTKSACLPCQKGFYQPHKGRDYCNRCPGATTTDMDAATDQMDCKSQECGHVFSKGDFTGFIQSPNYPGDYPTNVSCVWKIRPNKDRRILVIVPEVFFPPGCKDRLVMRKSKNAYSTVSYEECKTTMTPGAFIARSKRLWLHFQSDGANTAKGFSIPFVTFNPIYQRLIESIITDGNLYKSEQHQAVLKDRRRLPILMEVIEKPELFFLKYTNATDKLFPASFIKLLRKKVGRFYYPRYK